MNVEGLIYGIVLLILGLVLAALAVYFAFAAAAAVALVPVGMIAWGGTFFLAASIALGLAALAALAIGAMLVAKKETKAKDLQKYGSWLMIAGAIALVGAILAGIGALTTPVGFVFAPLGITVGWAVFAAFSAGITLLAMGAMMRSTEEEGGEGNEDAKVSQDAQPLAEVPVAQSTSAAPQVAAAGAGVAAAAAVGAGVAGSSSSSTGTAEPVAAVQAKSFTTTTNANRVAYQEGSMMSAYDLKSNRVTRIDLASGEGFGARNKGAPETMDRRTALGTDGAQNVAGMIQSRDIMAATTRVGNPQDAAAITAYESATRTRQNVDVYDLRSANQPEGE